MANDSPMSANVSENAAHTRRERAASLVAADLMPDLQIAAEIGITERTLERWKKDAHFQSRVVIHRNTQAEVIKAEGIANLQNRVDALNDRWRKLQQVIAERAADPDMLTVPGGTTGLLVHQVKAIGAGRSQTIVDEYAVDAGTLRELRAHEEQAAKELGQWEDKQRISGEMIVREYVGVDPEAV